MSIKKLFGSVEDGRNYLSDTDQKDAFKDVESERNLEQLKDKQTTFVPQVDYTLPSRFAKFGSAYLYYKGAMNQITDYYPYDGSDAEINQFYNNLLDIEKYIFNNLYPRRNGYVKLAESTGTGHSVTGTTGAGVGPAGYAIPTTNEYITLKAGPHAVNATASLVQSSNDPYSQKFQYSNIYDTSIYTTKGLPSDYGQGTRQSNLQSNFDTGVSIEFWMKKPSFNSSEDGNRETIFDLWTSGSHTSSADYGRIILELTGGATATSPFLLTVHSGATSAFTRVEIGSASLTPSSLATWTHIGLVMYNTGSDFISKLYVNGALNNTQTAAGTTINQLKQKDTMARLGALLTAPNDADFRVDPGVLAGANKLSASLDEFRFWKVKRSAQDIGRYWFTQVRGGSNTDISNTTLGVYYKFNEGITDNSTIDSNVLDYSGRISNGTWTGYGTNSRTINSAIVEASASATEYKDPIIYSTHPRVAGLKEGLLESGSYHDDNNNSLFMNYSPNWVIEEHRDNENSNLAIISHIMGTYFDKIYLQSRELPRLKGTNYTSASAQPVPFAQHLPQSLGLYTPQIFIDATVMERFLDRNNDSRFSGSLEETKNLIYLNLYNNLTNIFKSKGTEKALRNVLRCFNVDEKLIKINTYANNTTFPLSNNYEQVLETKNYVNFNKISNRSAVIYQSVSGSGLQSVNTASLGGPGVARGFISASTNTYEYNYGATVEAEVLFPYWDNRNYSADPRDYTAVSLFGMVTPETGSEIGLSGSDTTIGDPNPANFRVYAIKESADSKNVYFYLTSSIADTGEDGPMPVLSSSAFFNVYDNTIWNFSVRVEPQHDTPTIYVAGGGAQDGSATYNVVFEGRNIDSGFVRNKFSVSGTMTSTVGNSFLNSAKRLFAGAERTNLTGTLVNKSDVLIGSMKYWAKYLQDGTLVQHAHDVDNYGISGSYRNVSAIDTKNSTADVLNLNTLALNWTFGQVTGSNAGGNFTIGDLSSGSALLQDNYATMGRITGYRHLGWGYGFPASSSGSIKKKQINTFKFIEPERATSGDAIQILSEDDKVFGVVETVPNYVYTVEKSMYRAISEEMLDFFAGVVDFNNLIGAPVNRYRHRYKALEQLRAIFFERVTKTSQVEKFVEYYKWFDDAISQIMGQLVPASSDFTSDVYNTIESHALERNKYMTQYPTLETKAADPNANIFGVGEMGVDYSQQSTTLTASPRSTREHIPFWKKRAKRSSPEITSGDATIDTQRETYRIVINSSPRFATKPVVVAEAGGSTYEPALYASRNYQKLYSLKHGKANESLIHGGVNFERSKNIHYVYSSLYPFGPIDTTDGRFVPLNVLLGLTKDMVSIENFLDNRDLRRHVKRTVLVQSGRDWQKGVGYENMKSTIAFPFNIMSSSVTTGFNQEVVNNVGAGLEITNLHNDVYGPDMEVPMQGPFTEKYVGGHQSRHVGLNTGTDTYKTRPEAWKLLVGECPDQGTGSVGMASPTYPYPDIGAPPTSSGGSVRVIGTLYPEDYVTISDGDTQRKFEIPFENTKATNFPNSDSPSIQVGGTGAPTGSELYELDQWTISAWIRLDAAGAGSRTIFQCGATAQTRMLYVRANDKLRYSCYWSDNVASGGPHEHYWEATTALSDSTWYHIALVYDGVTGSNSPVFYINGAVDAISDEPFNKPAGTLVAFDAGSRARVGGSQGSSAAFRFEGDLDEVSIWQLTMSADQVTELYATGSVLDLFNHSLYTADNTNLYSWWRMGDDTNDAIDGTGNYDLGTNSIVDQVTRSNGNPSDDVTTTFATDVTGTWASALGAGTSSWTNGATAIIAATNLKTAIDATSLNISTSRTSNTVYLNNTKYGIPSSTKRDARGSLGNWPYPNVPADVEQGAVAYGGTSGGADPVILNFNAPRATYYRDFIAKSPVNIRNIQMKTGSTIIGNYQHNYEVVNSVGAFGNPRSFIENQPTLPSVITSNTNLNKGGSASFEGTQTGQAVLNYLTLNRESASHFDFGLDYGVTDNSGAYANKSIIVSRFGAPGSRETMARGYQDFRSSEYSVYNTVPYRNLTVLDAGGAGTYVLSSMDPTALIVTSSGYQITASGYRVNDLHNRPFGLRQHLARHSGRFGRDSYAITGATFALNGPGASYNQLPAYNKTNRNPQKKLIIAYDGNYLTSSQRDNYFVSHQIPRSDRQYLWITSSLVSENDYFRYLPRDYMVSTSVGYIEPYTFVTASNFGAMVATTGSATAAAWGNAESGIASPYSFIPVDFVGLNTVIYEPLSASSNVLGYPALSYIVPSNIDSAMGRMNIINTTQLGTFAGASDYDLTVDNFNNSAYASSANLEGWWRLSVDLSSTGDVIDSSGNTRNLEFPFSLYRPEFQGSPSPFIQTGSWYSADTTTQATSALTGPQWDAIIGTGSAAEQMTLAFWTKITKPDSNFSFGLLGFDTQGYYDNAAVTFGNNTLWFSFMTTWDDKVPTWWSTPNYTITKNEWHHIAITYDASNYANDAIIYLDGEAVADVTQHGTEPTGGSTWDGILYPFRINPNVNMDGINFADVGVWSSILTADEIKDLYDSAGLQASVNTNFPKGVGGSLNGLLLHRNGPWGWPTWKQIDYDNPLTRYEHRNNTLSVYAPEHKPGSDFKYFDLSPVSMRGRPAKINFDTSDTEDVTLVASHNNMEIFFKSNELNDMVGVDYDEVSTPLEQVMEITRVNPSYSPNWIMYSENIFPSSRNEFESYSGQRTGYDNKYWARTQERDNATSQVFTPKAPRVEMGLEISNSFGITLNHATLPSPNYGTPLGNIFLELTQSVWPLDPPQDFMTRTFNGMPFNRVTSSLVDDAFYYPIISGTQMGSRLGEYSNIFRGTAFQPTTLIPGNRPWDTDLKPNFGGAGELQNYYVMPAQLPQYYAFSRGETEMSPGSLYARKHTLGSPRSVVSPTGIAIPATGSLTGTFDNYEQLFITSGSTTGLPQGNGIWAGEAAWDAPINAKIIVQDGRIERSISYPSDPWFATYDDFKQDLKLKAKDFSIVPEFRISEHVTSFKRHGITNQDKSNIFEIPGTGINSATTSSFYLDYSNSEFLKDFLKIKEDSLLDATEIKLECEAAIRFNPYKGFYPVQRSMDLISQWSSSYFDGVISNLRGIGGEITGAFGRELLRVNGGAIRPLIAPLFAPGILYNSIKSGMAVDYPVITDGTKILKWPFLSSSVALDAGTPGQYDLTNDTWISASSPYVYTSSADLQGWWRLNEDLSSTGDATDSSTHSRDGTFAGTPGRPGYSDTSYPGSGSHASTSYIFSGVDKASCTFSDANSAGVDIGAPATWQAVIGTGGTSLMTIAAWIRVSDMTDTNDNVIVNMGGENAYLTVRPGHATDAGKFFFFTRWNGGTLRYWYTGDLSTTFDDIWTHVAVTYDATDPANHAKIYINGEAQSLSAAGTAVAPWDGIITDDSYIGNNDAASTDFNGGIADVAIWDSILTAGEIKALALAKDFTVGGWGWLKGTNYFNYAITPNATELKQSADDPTGYTGTGSFWDKRIPFEAIIKPELYMARDGFIDMESHPSASLYHVTTSMGNSPNDDLYSLMASNYFAEIGNFFLNKSQYTKLESDVVADKLLFESGSVYAARIKLRRSTTGPRIYTYEPDSNGNTFAAMSAPGHEASFYRPLGGTSVFNKEATPGLPDSFAFFPTGAFFPIPQDPQFPGGALTGLFSGEGSAFRESFTLYSRPTAFGPPVAAGRISGTLGAFDTSRGQGREATPTQVSAAYMEEDTRHPMDSYNGYNWAFTPPYYNGESWADIIFRPTARKEYSVEDILSEVSVKYWRYDGGGHGRAGDLGAERSDRIRTTLPQTDAPGTCKLGFTGSGNHWAAAGTGRGSISGAYVGSVPGIYDADSINRNAMQMSASINLFGIEKVQFTERDSFGNIVSTRDTSTGTKWVIQPKFETPHLNFNKTYSQAKMPSYGSASVPIGIWHQFGEISTDPNVGIFLEIDDIPKQWQKYHYEMYMYDSIYNDNNAAGFGNQQPFKSLSKVFGFKDESKSKRLGEMHNAQTLREAIVAIPYITEISPSVNPAVSMSNELIQTNKKFINIPIERFEAAQKAIQGSLEGDSLLTAGESIRKLLQKMNRYILPPQFDFMNNRAVDPMVMYIFEFEYKLDRDDLSYIWQNLAPRDYKKLTFQKSSIAHELMDTELLSQANIMDNPNLRWMIFKVKQRSQATYEQATVAQAGETPRDPFLRGTVDPETGYKIAYNWPYDYISFVEMIKIDAQVLYGGRGGGSDRLAANGTSPSPLLESPSDLTAPTPTTTPTITPTQQQGTQFSAFDGSLLETPGGGTGGGPGGTGGGY